MMTELEIKQACLDLATAAGDMFDQFEKYGLNAAWEPGSVEIITEIMRNQEKVVSFIRYQASARLAALTGQHRQ